MCVYITHSAEETGQLAARIGARLRSGDVVLLLGELGTGKTTFTQGLARGMGIRVPVTSPTFTLIHEYLSSGPSLYHFDTYRLNGPEEIADLGFEEYLEREGVVVVEWPEKLGIYTPMERLLVRLEKGEEDIRRISLTPYGDRYMALLRELEGTPC
jgi:tRNA threonylcarbamoyladenosine biosynthesis protein TsaE